MPTRLNRIVAAGAASLVLFASACSSDSKAAPATTPGTTPTTGSTGGAGGAAGATISGYAFQVSGSPKAGTPFTVTNSDGVPHTFTNPQGAFDVGVPGGGSAQITVAKAGTYTIICKIHGSMKGTITIG